MGSPDGPTRAFEARRLDLHERDEAVHFGLVRREFGEDAAQAQRILAQRRPHHVIAGRRGIPLVEDEVDDFEHRREAFGAFLPRPGPRTARALRKRSLRAHDPLGDRRLAGETRAISAVVKPPSRRSVRATRASTRAPDGKR
jgi:hypothetical protein